MCWRIVLDTTHVKDLNNLFNHAQNKYPITLQKVGQLSPSLVAILRYDK